MGKGYNNYMTKKPFHPGSKANIKRTWMAEQRTENEKRKQEDLKVQYEKEQDLYNNRALLSTESKDKLELNFMYEAPPGAKRERQKEDDEPEYKFEWQRKYNAPREDYAKGNAEIRDQPFGIPVRNVRCIKCHKWGHINTDKECPLFNSSSASSMPSTSMDPLELMRQMREDGYNLKQNVLGHHVNPRLANQQYVHSDDDDDNNGEEDPEMEFLKSLTSKQKKKLLKKLNKLSKKQKKKEEAKKKKKQKERDMSDSDSAEKPKKMTKKKKDISSEHSESSSSEEKQQPDIATSTGDRSLQKSKKRHEVEDAEDSGEPKKGKKGHHSGESKGDNRSASSKHNAPKHDEKRHKRKRDSRKHGESDSSSSEEDDYQRAKKRSPDTAVDIKKPEKSKKREEDDLDDELYSSSKDRKHGSKVPECKKDKKKDKHDSRQSDSQSSPEKGKRSHKEKLHGDNNDKRLCVPMGKHDDKDYDILQHSNSNKKSSPSSHKNVNDGSSTSKEGTTESKKTSGSPNKSEKAHTALKSTQKIAADTRKSIHPEEMSAHPSTSKQSKHNLEDEDNFVKPSRSFSSRNKSPSASRISPEHPDGFSHESPQQKSVCKEPEEAGTSKSDLKYLGSGHDRFRDLHRHRRSPSIKHKYQS